MKERTDTHRPSVMDPSEYVYVGAADNHPGDSYLEVRHDILARNGVETGSSDPQSSANVPFYNATEDGRPNYRCHHCGKHGSNIYYFVFFLHKPSKQVIVVGQICAKKLNLGSREELDLQKRADEFRRLKARRSWVDDHEAEYNFLREYDEQAEGGWYSEFFESLWDKLQQFGSLTDGQVTGLGKWMSRGKPWERDRPEVQSTPSVDADRHKAEVTHHEDPPTEAQLEYIKKLEDKLGNKVPEMAPLMTRIDASDWINTLKALVQEREVEQPSASDKQVSFINKLMDERVIPSEQRKKARQMLDNGLTKNQASRWIEALLLLPEIGD